MLTTAIIYAFSTNLPGKKYIFLHECYLNEISHTLRTILVMNKEVRKNSIFHRIGLGNRPEL